MRTLASSTDFALITERLSLVEPTDRARWGVMNSQEMICHLRGAFRLAMGEITVARPKASVTQPILKLLALRLPIRWSKNFETVPALKRGAPAMQVGSFHADKEDALAELIRFCRPDQHRSDHPYMGSMSFSDWMRWGYLHTDHHLRQFGR